MFFSKFFLNFLLPLYISIHFFISRCIHALLARVLRLVIRRHRSTDTVYRHCVSPCVYTVQKRGNRSRRCMHLARIYTVNRRVERSKQHTCARDKRDRARRRARSPRSVSRLSHRAGSKGPVQDTEASTQEA